MNNGYKILRSDFTSVRDEGRVNYLPDPSAPLPGPWIDVPGLGAFVSMAGAGLYCGGVPKDWRCVQLEVGGSLLDARLDACPTGVMRWRRVRVIAILDQLPSATQTGNIVVHEGASLTLPSATQTGNIVVCEGASLTLTSATQTGNIVVHEGGKIIRTGGVDK
jgi:hypothetical protein